jgi:hypothetical protein
MRLAAVRLRFSRGCVVDANLVVVASPCTVVRHVDLRVPLPNRLGANGNDRMASGKAEKGSVEKGQSRLFAYISHVSVTGSNKCLWPLFRIKNWFRAYVCLRYEQIGAVPPSCSESRFSEFGR